MEVKLDKSFTRIVCSNRTGVGPTIPSRPRGPSCGGQTVLQVQDHGYAYDYATRPEIRLAGSGSNALHPMMSMFGDIIYVRPLGNPLPLGYGQLYSGVSEGVRGPGRG